MFGALIAEDAGMIDLNCGSAQAPPARPAAPPDASLIGGGGSGGGPPSPVIE